MDSDPGGKAARKGDRSQRTQGTDEVMTGRYYRYIYYRYFQSNKRRSVPVRRRTGIQGVDDKWVSRIFRPAMVRSPSLVSVYERSLSCSTIPAARSIFR